MHLAVGGFRPRFHARETIAPRSGAAKIQSPLTRLGFVVAINRGRKPPTAKRIGPLRGPRVYQTGSYQSMKRFITAVILFTFLSSAFADEGMWTFDNPPLKQWKERYNFEPSREWLERVRLASPKIGTASGVFVSANGLIATNHHVASSIITKLSTKERDLMKTGFYAKTQADELKAQDAEITVLLSYEDVTARVNNAAKTGTDDADAAAKRRAEITSDRESMRIDGVAQVRGRFALQRRRVLAVQIEGLHDVRLCDGSRRTGGVLRRRLRQLHVPASRPRLSRSSVFTKTARRRRRRIT
jgi:hypothetical protein